MASTDTQDAPAFQHFIPSIPDFKVSKSSFIAAATAPRTQRSAGGTPSGTDNTRNSQSTGLGPSVQDPRDADYSDPTRKASPFLEIGSSGLAQYGGFVRDEFLPQLQGDAGLRVFREMFDNDPIVGALVFAVQMLMRKVEWRVEPPESPTVEGIVAARQKERMQMLAQQRQAVAMQAAQGAGGQGNGASSLSPGGKPGAPAPSPQPTPSFAAPNGNEQTPFHQPLPELAGHTSPPTGPPGPQNQPSSTPPRPGPSGSAPTRPGANAQPTPFTKPSSNFPAGPDKASSNPGGGPNQSGAISGQDGLPGGRPPSIPAPAGDPGSDLDSEGLPRKFTKAFDEWYGTLEKGGASGGGGMVGGIEAFGVGNNPMDPETGESMDFPIGMSPLDAPSPEETKALELAVLIETCLHDLTDSWSDLISQIITMIVYGFSFHELVYKKRNGPNPDDPTMGSRYADGKIGWAKIAGRAQETRHRWEFDEFGNILGMWQLAPPKFQLKYLPMSKCLLFRTTGYKQNPEGRSILRSAYRPWYFKRRIEEYEAMGVERNLAGMPVAYVPYQWMSAYATPEETSALDEVKRIVRNVRNDEQAGLVFPSVFDPDTKQPLFKFELLSAGSGSGSKVQDTDKIIGRYDQRIAMVALVDFILLGHESVGSKSLADTKADLFTTALEAWLSVIADVFNTYAIPRLIQMNGEDPAMSPRLTFGKLARVGLLEISQLITALAGAGADLFPDNILEDYIREAAGLPPKQATDDL